ncbi:MAG: PAS domain-containing protein [Lentisphaerae bacterium]|nr:PAS domain-containing protein [Lentisphaerota bacterium]
MNLLPSCILFTRDAELAQRIGGNLEPIASIRQIDDMADLDVALRQRDPAVLFVDLTERDAIGTLEHVRVSFLDTLVVALGRFRSDPALEAEARGAYAVEDRDVARPRLQALCRQAFAHIDLAMENRSLREAAAGVPRIPPAADRGPGDERVPSRATFHSFAEALGRFENADSLLDHLLDGVANWAKVSRIGVFARELGEDAYSFRAGIRCLEETRELRVAAADPLVQWMDSNAHLVARSLLANVEDEKARRMLRQSMDRLGAEVLVPLHGRHRLLGWLFVGRRVAGIPFDRIDLEDLMLLAGHAGIAFENSLLYREVTVRKTQAETVLQSIPSGIVTVDSERRIRGLNKAAETILDLDAKEVVGQRSGELGSRLADLLRTCLERGDSAEALEWVDPLTKRSLSILARRLTAGEDDLGAVAIVRDMTREAFLRERQQRLERGTFWTELAAAISHEVRNPLVAISTFAQLLPERYDDPDFRTQFSGLVSEEIRRLSGLIDQIDSFANPPELNFKPVRVDAVVSKAVEAAITKVEPNGCRIETHVGGSLPRIEGDEVALVDCLAHLVVNGLEALKESKDALLTVSAARERLGQDEEGVLIRVEDNGNGIPLGISDKVFSPFCTMKARGIGLGLPIVKRTVTDHRGHVRIETSQTGTCVSVTLPAEPNSKEGADEAHTRG